MSAREPFVYGYHPATGEPVTDPDEFEALLRDVLARRVALTRLEFPGVVAVVSTVHTVTTTDALMGADPAALRLWQTAVWLEVEDDPEHVYLDQWRQDYASREAAEVGHRATVATLDARRGGGFVL